MGIRIARGMKVKIAYLLTDSDGRVLEERTPENPYEFIQGDGAIVAALERSVEGKTAGFSTEISLSPREGYGEYNSALVTDVPRTHLPAEIDLLIGMKFNTMGADGEPVIVRVTEFNDRVVTLDGNHPLAGLDLTFELRVLDVADPSVLDDRVELVVTTRKTISDKH